MAKKRTASELRTLQLKKWDETNFKYLDVIVSSGEIRRLFFQRCKYLKLDPYRVAMEAGIAMATFQNFYVLTPTPNCTKGFSQEKFLVLLELVGIDIKVLVKPKPFSEVYVELVKRGLIKEK